MSKRRSRNRSVPIGSRAEHEACRRDAADLRERWLHGRGAYNGGPPHIHFIITPPGRDRLLGAVNFHGDEFDTFGPVEALPADAGPRVPLGESEGLPLCHWKMTLPE